MTTINKIAGFIASILLMSAAYAEPKPASRPISAQSMASIQAVADESITHYNERNIKQPAKIGIPKIINGSLPQCEVPLQVAWQKELEADQPIVKVDPDQLEPARYDEQFVLQTSEGEILAYTPYIITSSDGQIIKGITDAKGKTQRVYTCQPETLTLELTE